MKAYGIRFDVMVNGRVCERGRPRAGLTCWEGSAWSPWGSRCAPASLTMPVSLCASGGEVQHHPHSHQRGLGGGAHGCCEYLSPPSPLPSEHRWGRGTLPQGSCPVSADAGKEAFLELHPPAAVSGGRDCLSFSQAVPAPRQASACYSGRAREASACYSGAGFGAGVLWDTGP